MNREVIITGDGSPTLFVPELNEHYHSIHGALNESMHVFIQNGLIHQLTIHQHIHLLEIGLHLLHYFNLFISNLQILHSK